MIKRFIKIARDENEELYVNVDYVRMTKREEGGFVVCYSGSNGAEEKGRIDADTFMELTGELEEQEKIDLADI
jgi:hypothetical protein